MKILLVDCAIPHSKREVDRGLDWPHLGLLSLIPIVAATKGQEVQLASLTMFGRDQKEPCELPELVERFVRHMCDQGADVLGLTTRTDTLPLVLDVAARFKAVRPDVPVVLGGPGSAFVDRDILTAFPQVDIIVRGEGEVTFAELVTCLRQGVGVENVQGISLRSRDGKIIRNRARPRIEDLDSIPDAPYEILGSEYLRGKFLLHIPVGRGCPNDCSFCSTRVFWGRGVRMRSPERVVAEMQRLHDAYGVNLFTLIHDNILSDVRFMKTFIRLKQRTIPQVEYLISASLNMISRRTLRGLRRSGCRAIFVGVETASSVATRVVARKYTPPAQAYKKLKAIEKRGIKLTKSHIIGFPGETSEDIDKTLMLAIEGEARASISIKNEVQVHMLTALPGTSAYHRVKEDLSYTGVTTDFSNHAILGLPPCLDICKRHSSIVSSYATWRSADEQIRLLELTRFYYALLPTYARSLCVAMHELDRSPTGLYELFKRTTKGRLALDSEADPDSKVSPGLAVASSFRPVILQMYAQANISSDFLLQFLNVEEPACFEALQSGRRLRAWPAAEDRETLWQHVATVPSTTRLVTFRFSPEKVIHRLLRHGTCQIGQGGWERLIIYCLLRARRSGETYHVYTPSRWMAPCIKRIFKHVDGKGTYGEILDRVCRDLVVKSPTSRLFKMIRQEIAKMASLGILSFKEDAVDAT